MAIFTAIGASIFGAGTFLAGLTAATLQIAAGIGVSLIAKSLAGEPEKAKFGVQGRLQGGDDIPRSILFGYNCTAGSLVYGNTWGTVDGLPNAYLTQVVALADYPIRELIGVEVNGASVTLGTTAHPNFGFPVNEFRRNGYDHLWVKFYDGTQTAADPFLVNTVSSSARPYSVDRVGRGVPYVITTAMAHQRNDGEEEALFSGFPTFKFVTNGARLYDISKDSTAGGDGPQRWSIPSTWGGDGDFLPAVQIYNVLRGIRFNNGWLYGLQISTPANLPNENWVNAVNKCRAPIQGQSGMEPTYRTGGEIQVGAQIKFTLEAMLTGCQGRLSEIGGVYKLNVGEPDASVAFFTDNEILSTEEQTFTPFFTLEDTINGIQATYPNPAESWNTKTAPPLYRPDLEALSDNRRLLADVTLDMVPYPAQVQRLMKAALAEAQRARRHTLTLGPEFWVLEPGDIITWTSERNGYEQKLFRVDGMSDQPNLDILVDITEVDPSDYDWNQNTDFRPVTNIPIQIVTAPPLPMIGWQVYAVAIRDQQDRERKAAIEIWYQSGIQDVDRVKFQVRRYGTTEIFLSGEVPYGSPWRTVIQGDFPPDAEFEVRGIFVRNSGGLSEWSDWLYVKTLNVKLIPGVDFDPFDGIVGLDQLSQDLQNMYGLVTDPSINGSIPDQLDALQQLAEQLAATVIDLNATTKKRIDILRTTQAGTNAAVIRAETAIAEETFARAEAITEVLASVGDVIADGYLKFEAEVDESASTAQISAKVKATSGSDFSEAAWILRATADGLGGTNQFFGVLGNFYVFGSENGVPIPVFAANSDGTVTMRAQKVETITAGRLQSPDGNMVIDLTQKVISISTG